MPVAAFKHARGWVLGLLLPAAASAGTFDGRVTLEMEYLGESYFSEQMLSAEDLGLPTGTSLVVAETTRFTDDTWLPGPRLELRWRAERDDADLEISSATALNHERFAQTLEATARRTDETGRWRLRARAGLHEEQRSLVGDGDWSARIEAEREQDLGSSLRGALRAAWDHSRIRGDTTSYLYDYDLARVRAQIGGGGRWLPVWEATLEGVRKLVPDGEPGAYREARLGGAWYPGTAMRRSLTLDLRLRDYDDGVVGRDFRSAEAVWRSRLMGSDTLSWGIETGFLLSDYVGEDELYFDGADLSLTLPWRRENGTWTVSAGPALRWLRDLGGGDRDYLQGTGKGSVGRLGAGGGFSEIDLEAGYRNYRSAETEVIEISSLSSSLLRSDYWLVDLLALVNQPVGRGLSVDLLASLSWEFHSQDSERIHIAFVTLSLVRSF